MALNLHGRLARAQLARDLLVRQPGHHEHHDDPEDAELLNGVGEFVEVDGASRRLCVFMHLFRSTHSFCIEPRTHAIYRCQRADFVDALPPAIRQR
jgi:hypothetical protein